MTVCGKAHTGSGKTLAFGIPLVAQCKGAQPKRPRGLVLVPTRELAAQVARRAPWLGHGRKVRVAAVYGGAGFGAQLKAMRRGVDMLVACPGPAQGPHRAARGRPQRGRDRRRRRSRPHGRHGLPARGPRLLDQTPDNRQTLLFSATLDGAVDTLVRNYQHDPARHEVADDPDEHLARHAPFWRVDRSDARVQVAADVIRAAGPTIVFCRTKHGTDSLAKKLGRIGVARGDDPR